MRVVFGAGPGPLGRLCLYGQWTNRRLARLAMCVQVVQILARSASILIHFGGISAGSLLTFLACPASRALTWHSSSQQVLVILLTKRENIGSKTSRSLPSSKRSPSFHIKSSKGTGWCRVCSSLSLRETWTAETGRDIAIPSVPNNGYVLAAVARSLARGNRNRGLRWILPGTKHSRQWAREVPREWRTVMSAAVMLVSRMRGMVREACGSRIDVGHPRPRDGVDTVR